LRILIKNGIIVNAEQKMETTQDILIDNNKIIKINSTIDEQVELVIDAEGKYVLPGLVDAHCHLREPGYEYKEDIESGTRSAAAGGFTSIACMPNTKPVVDNQAIVKFIIDKARNEGYVNVYPIGAITKGLEGKELAEIGELKFAGAVAISDDGKPVQNASLMKKAMQYASMFDITVISHCEDMDLLDGGTMNEGYQATTMGLRGIPAIAEEVMVSRELLLAEYLNAGVHIAHISTERSVDLIRHAKKRGVKVTCETCPHYFTLTESACEGFNTFAKMNPPLRIQKDVDAILEGIKDGTIDIIATDHAPHHIDEKNVEFELAANGIVGFETAFALSYTYLVKTGVITIEQLVNKMSLKPSKILGLNKGVIQEGRVADITIVDINKKYTVDIEKFKSKSKNSPFGGFELYGTIEYTIVNGKLIVRDGIFM